MGNVNVCYDDWWAIFDTNILIVFAMDKLLVILNDNDLVSSNSSGYID